MLVELLTLGSVLVNVGYQLPQVFLLRQRAANPASSGGKSPLSGPTILIKTTGLYLACGYFILNEVPLLSWIHQLTSIGQDWAMVYYCGVGRGLTTVLAQLTLHAAVVIAAILLTPIAAVGSLCKTVLTLAFKIKSAAAMVALKVGHGY